MKVYFKTFGCRLNRAEALDLEAKFLANGWEKAEDYDDADLVIVRGCSVTVRAQRDTEKLIARLREKYPAKRIFTTGCLTDKTPDAMIERAMHGSRPESEWNDFAVPVSTSRAYLKVQDGCNGQCTFCIVPRFRGQSVSEDFDAVLARAKRFLDCGYTELIVTGCNLSLYLSGGKRLPELLEALADIQGYGHRVRLGSLEPGPVAADVVRVIAERDNICKFLHIPIQSASNRILAEMRRPYKVRDLNTLIEKALQDIPVLGLGCDIITGFPGETDSDFCATFDFIKRLPFNNIHAFPYSERPGTMAEKIIPIIDKPLRSARARDLMALVRDKRKLFTRKFKGRTVEIVIEDAATLSGWTSEYLWCTSRSAGKISPHRPGKPVGPRTRKSLIKMRVNDLDGDILYAEPI